MDLKNLPNLGKVAQLNINSEVTQHIHLAAEKSALSSDIPTPKGFIGRKTELSVLKAEKDKGKTSFVLHGLGGVGKTDLALKFIDEIKTAGRKCYRVNLFGLSENALSPTTAMLEVIKKFQPEVPADLKEEDIKKPLHRAFERISADSAFRQCQRPFAG